MLSVAYRDICVNSMSLQLPVSTGSPLQSLASYSASAAGAVDLVRLEVDAVFLAGRAVGGVRIFGLVIRVYNES